MTSTDPASVKQYRLGFGRTILFFLAATLAACQPSTFVDTATTREQIQANQSAAQPDEYVLQSDDVLSVKFFYSPELNERAVIRRDGKITLQLVGEVSAAGLKPEELKRNIKSLYEGILRDPEVAVIVDQLAPRTFAILGGVNRPGSHPHEPGMTVVKAIAIAGGFSSRSRQTGIQIVKATDPSQTPIPADRTTRVDPGDVVEVPGASAR